MYAPLHAIPTVAGAAAIAVCGFVQLARRYLSDRTDRAVDVANGGLPLIVALALATPIGVLLYSVLGKDIGHVEHLYAAGPAALLALGGVLVAIPRGPRAVAVPVVLACFCSERFAGSRRLGSALRTAQPPDISTR